MVDTRAIPIAFALTLAAGWAVNCVPLLHPVAAPTRAAAGSDAWGCSPDTAPAGLCPSRDTTPAAVWAVVGDLGGAAAGDNPAVQCAIAREACKTGSPALLSAIIAVESGGDPNAVGDNGRAVGILQIHPIMVREANRILGRDEFTLADRYSPERSVAIFDTYCSRWCVDATDEQIARRWNGGCRGDTKEATAAYWARVQAAMK